MHPTVREIRARFLPGLRRVLRTASDPAVHGAAFPAYAHRNPLVGLVFWRRLSVAVTEARRHGGKRALDFGSGAGIMSEALAAAGFDVTAVDVDQRPSGLLGEQCAFSSSISFIEGDLLTLNLPAGAFDVIVALDVLEHIEPLGPYLGEFERLLAPGGVVIISGPTENRLYRLGRRLAGAEFTGHYHVSDIHDVAESARERFEVRTVARIVWPATLFEVLSCRRKVA